MCAREPSDVHNSNDDALSKSSMGIGGRVGVLYLETKHLAWWCYLFLLLGERSVWIVSLGSGRGCRVASHRAKGVVLILWRRAYVVSVSGASVGAHDG